MWISKKKKNSSFILVDLDSSTENMCVCIYIMDNRYLNA